MAGERHLWDVEHSYARLVETTNYFASARDGGPVRVGSWAAFAAEFADSDDDLNFVIRWDWRRADKEHPSQEHDELAVYFLKQRKGIYWCALVRVTEADEPAVRAWLKRKWDYVRRLWEPLAGDGT